MRKTMFAFAFAILCFLLFSSLTMAGGWAVATLDFLPTRLVVKQPATIGFNVRQHGQTLVPGLNPKITATRVDSEDLVTATAHDEGPAGHYAATITFPRAGQWQWYIDAFGSQQPMPTLTVLASSSEASTALAAPLPVDSRVPLPYALIAAVAALGIAAVLAWLVIWRKHSSRRLVVPMFAALLLILAALVLLQAFSQPVSSAGARETNQEQTIQVGHDLFIAKGCIVCHQNDRARYSQSDFFPARIGPNLTTVKLTSEYLRTWLKDPSRVKPGTQMPTLGLSDEEIDALVVFLRAD